MQMRYAKGKKKKGGRPGQGERELEREGWRTCGGRGRGEGWRRRARRRSGRAGRGRRRWKRKKKKKGRNSSSCRGGRGGGGARRGSRWRTWCRRRRWCWRGRRPAPAMPPTPPAGEQPPTPPPRPPPPAPSPSSPSDLVRCLLSALSSVHAHQRREGKGTRTRTKTNEKGKRRDPGLVWQQGFVGWRGVDARDQRCDVPFPLRFSDSLNSLYIFYLLHNYFKHCLNSIEIFIYFIYLKSLQ